MINLLNPTRKKYLRAARRNTIWRRYTLLVAASVIAINVVFGLTALFIFNQNSTYKQLRDTNESRLTGTYKNEKKRAQAFRDNLATAKAIIGQQTNYSDVIIAIAHTIPEGCVMESLTLSSQTFGTPQSFPFRCKLQADSVRLKTAFEQNTSLFDKVNIVSTSQNSDASDSHKVSVTLSAILLRPKPDTEGGL